MTMIEQNSKLQTDRAIPAGLTQAGQGRPPGTVNRTTKQLKDAIILGACMAAARVNYKAVRSDPNASAEEKAEAKAIMDAKAGTLEDYCAWLAEHHPASFAALLGRVLPIQIKSQGSPLDPAAASGGVAELGQAIAFALRLGAVPKPEPKIINATPNPERKI